MKIRNKLLVGAAFIATAVPTFANADGYQRSVVQDARGNAVTTLYGTCVTHDYPESSNGLCKGTASLTIPNVVYFDFDRSTLNAKGKQVIDEVAAGINGLSGSPSVTLSGHADRVSSSAYNDALSNRRANTVKKALIARGVDAGSISTEAFGENSNAVPTADNVPEQLNRRVEISITN